MRTNPEMPAQPDGGDPNQHSWARALLLAAKDEAGALVARSSVRRPSEHDGKAEPCHDPAAGRLAKQQKTP